MPSLILSRNAGRQALGRTWRLPPVRHQHAAPAADALDDVVAEPTMSRASIYGIIDPARRYQQPTRRHAAPVDRNPLSPERANGEINLRQNEISTPLRLLQPELIIKGPLQLRPVLERPGFDQPLIDTDGQLKCYTRHGRVAVPGRWLRDMCTCPDCRHPDTAQNKVNVLQDNRTGKVRHIRETILPKTGETAFKIVFADGHRSTLPAATIVNRNRGRALYAHRTGQIPIIPWKSAIASNPPSVEYTSVHSGPGLSTLLLKIRQYGFCFVRNTPPSPEATSQLLQTIGPIRTTHYGAFYDFTSDLSSKDTAYTSEALAPHTDNTYFTEPAGLQALHLLSHTSGATAAFPNPSAPDNDSAGDWEPHLGGESSLVDGFTAANHLFHANPNAYRLLSAYGVYAHASGNEGVSIQPVRSFPPFQHDNFTGKLMQIRWNTADRAGTTAPWDMMEQWYDAAAAFDALVNSKEYQYWFSLKPGKLLIFDNWRVMHGRAAFTGRRRMCGGYIPRDDYISKFRATNLSREEIAASTVTG